SAPEGVEEAQWAAARAAHRGFQAGMELLAVLPSLAEASGFYELSVNADLSIHIGERLLDAEHQGAMAKVLVPPPRAKADEILAESGGMFYSRETPAHEPYVRAGDHFDAGDPLYIIEVMKMFNKVYAPFSGTVDDVLVEDDGVIISKGQPLFKITPDEKIVIESPEEVAARRRAATDEFLAQLV
ncbi:MAG TPA: biotin carboxylase, partial [Halieaceae bacterium]|nr:biotin carboxylase [Halieaceae bacterium]